MSYSNTLLLGNTMPRSLTIEEASKPTREQTTLESILEFDESMYLEDMVLTSRFYTGLLESSDFVINETVIDALSEFLANVIIKITDFFGRIFGGFGGGGGDKDGEEKSSKKAIDYAKRIQANLKWIEENKKNFKYNDYDEETGTITVYTRANGMKPPTIENLTNSNIEGINKAAELSDRIAAYVNAGQIDPEEFKKMVAECTEQIEAAVSALDAVDVKDLIKSEKKEDVVLKEHAKECYKDTSIYSTYRKAASTVKITDYPQFAKVLNSMEKFKDKLKAKPEAMEPISVDIRELTTKQVGLCTRLTQKFAAYNGLMYQSIYVETSQVVSIMKKFMFPDQPATDEGEPTVESYITDDAQELIDAIAEATHEYNLSRYSRINYGMLQETRIKMNPDADVVYEMQILNEKVLKDMEKGFKKFTAKIKEIFAKFMEKLRANITTTRHYLNKYKDVIFNNKVPSDYVTKNILAGMDRCLNYEIPAFNYGSIKNSLETPYNFFSLLISDQNANIAGKFQPSADAQVSEENFSIQQVGKYFKEYFGITAEDVEISAAQVQGRIKDIYDFLYDANRIEKSIKKSINNIEKMRVAAMKQAGVEEAEKPTADGVNKGVNEPKENPAAAGATQTPPVAGTPNPNQTVTASGDSAKFSSYFTQVFQELERANDATKGTTNSASMTGKTAQNMKNVGAVETKDTSGQIQYGTKGTPVEEVERHLDNYSNVAVKVLEAKLTATEFVRSELMGIIRDIVQAYVSGETDKVPTQVNGKNKSPNTEKNKVPAGNGNAAREKAQKILNRRNAGKRISKKDAAYLQSYVNLYGMKSLQ